MPDRRRQIVQLLGSRFDYFPSLGGSLRTQAGLAPGERRPCPDCAHSDTPGWRVDAFKRRSPCLTCGGRPADLETGVRARRGKGVIHVDPMDATRQPIGKGDSRPPAKPRKTVLCDSCAGDGVVRGERCRYCDGEGRRPLHAFDLNLDSTGDSDDVDRVTRAVQRRNDAGSYHELDLALAGVMHHVNKPPRFLALTLNATRAVRLLDDLWLPPASRQESSLTRFEQSLVELALAYIDSRMPDPIRVPADVRVNERERAKHLAVSRGRLPADGVAARRNRDRQIRAWAREGKPYPWIGQQVGLSDRQLREIINRPVKREVAA